MAGADVASVHRVITEVLAFQYPIFVADQPILLNQRRIEFNLDFHVLGNRQQGGAHLFNQHLVGLLQGINVGVVAVTGVSQLFHQPIVIVAGSEAERGQGDAALALGFHQILQCLEIDRADIEIAVSSQDHPVDAVLDETLASQVVGQLNASPTVGGAAGAESIQCRFDFSLLTAGGRFQHDARCPGVHRYRYLVLGPQLLGQQFQCGFEQAELVRRFHRTGDVHQKHQVGWWKLGFGDVVAFDANRQQQGFRVPRGRRQFGADPERRLATGGQRVVVIKVVEQLFDSHCILRRQLALVKEAADIGISARIHVNTEG